MAVNVDPFVIQWPQKWASDPELAPTIQYLNKFLYDLWLRTGGSGDAISNITIEEKYAWDLSVNFAREQALTLPQLFSEKDDTVTLLQPAHEGAKAFNAVSAVSDYTAVDYDFVNAKKKSRVTLPKYPEENSVVIIRNGDGSIIGLNGNGRLINGESTGKIYRKGTTLTLQYFIEENEWFAR